MSPFLSLLVSEGGHAAAEGAHHFDVFEIGSMYINFFIFVGFLAFVLRKPLQTYLVSRREDLKKQLDEAKKKQAEADTRLADYEHKLANLEAEVGRIIQSFKDQGEADRARLSEDADRAIERLVREVDFTIQQESLKAQASLRNTAIEQTLKLAERLVTDRLAPTDHERITRDYVAKLQATPKTERS